jgi:DNA gyrase inhibitor GyrI
MTRRKIMSELEVRIVHLERLHLASSYGFGSSPELIAHQKMFDFLKSRNLLDGYGSKYRHFGFNNPDPTPGSPNYGYEVWVTVDPEVEPEGDIRIIEFPGGLYAVSRIEGVEKIGKMWGELVKWRERSAYKEAHHQYLENLINPLEADFSKFIFDLYLPIAE